MLAIPDEQCAWRRPRSSAPSAATRAGVPPPVEPAAVVVPAPVPDSPAEEPARPLAIPAPAALVR